MSRSARTLLLLAGLLLAGAAAPAAAPSAAAAELGIYAGAGCGGLKHLPSFTKWYGGKPPRMLDFFAFDSTWQSMVGETRWATQCWKRSGYKMTFSVPMLPNDHVSTLAAGARGDYDGYFRQIAKNLVDAGFSDAVLRIGWEFNGGWYTWSAKQDPVAWVAFWRHIVTAMRSVPGQSFRFDWCPSRGMQQIAPDRVYPGDEFVDIIGLDVYNEYWTAETAKPQPRWSMLVNDSFGLKWQAAFAASHHKLMSFPEWGTGTRPDGHGPGDDDYFIEKMAGWMRDHHVLYHDYWDYNAPDYRARIDDGQFPKSAAAFLKSFPHEDTP